MDLVADLDPAAPKGVSLVAGRSSREGGAKFTSLAPSTGAPGAVAFADATAAEVAAATGAAGEAARHHPSTHGQRQAVLRATADELEGLEDVLVSLLEHESGLPEARLRREFARTTAQLRFLADVVAEGSCDEAMLDHADRDHPALPRPELRRVLVPVGPVGVFGASNFPLAYSVAGGDTAAALAAGCPVVIKAHPAHPGASELVGGALSRAARTAGLPDGWVSVLQGRGHEVGQAIVLAPEVRAVGFTGSLAGGRALHDLGASRPDPIPVYAEMGSVNPIVVTRGALAVRADEIAAGYVGSVTTEGGQFCTKPGLLFVPSGTEGDGFVADVAGRIEGLEPSLLVSERVRDALAVQVEQTSGIDGVALVGRGSAPSSSAICHAPVVFATDVATFLANGRLREEAFGPSSLMVRYSDESELLAALEVVAGSLTATVQCESDELDDLDAVVASLQRLAGRLVFKGFPTGLAVSHATHHGGPYPAASSVLHSSVGATSIRRFLRPVSYQDAPPRVLPEALRDENPLGIMRRIDGRWTDEPFGP